MPTYFFDALPFALPAFVVGAVLAAALLVICRRRLRAPALIVGLWWVALIGVIAVLATPVSGWTPPPAELFFLRPWGFATDLDGLSPAMLASPNERSLNLVLTVPLGCASAWMARWGRWWAVAVAAAAPLVAEGWQTVATNLGRGPGQLADVVLNAAGLLVGFVFGWAVVRLGARGRSRDI